MAEFACHNIFRKSKFVTFHRIFYLQGNKCIFSHSSKASTKSHQFVSQCQYSTGLPYNKLHRKKIYSRNYFYLNQNVLMSTNYDSSKLQMVVTNPTQSSASIVDLPANSEQLNEVVKLSSVSGTSEVSHAVSSIDLSDAALSLSTNLQAVSQLTEPSFTSLGLAHWTPVGLIQMGLEYLHISLQMPWWAAIALSTVIARILLLPLLIKTQRNAINVANYMPQLQYLQTKFGEARKTGNTIEASRWANEIVLYMKEHNINPIKSALLPMCQAPVFISFFLGLRGMAKAPVDSMMYGGLGWTLDLTIPDPYYITPVIACGTLYIILKIGAESGVRLDNMKMTKYVLQAMPVIALPFCINFPAAVVYYWVTTNFCTLAFVTILKIQPVREFLKMPARQEVKEEFVTPKKGFMASVREAIDDQKVLSAIEERRRVDEVRFLKAGTGPIPRTYSYDPTKPRPANAAAAASRHTVSGKQNT